MIRVVAGGYSGGGARLSRPAAVSMRRVSRPLRTSPRYRGIMGVSAAGGWRLLLEMFSLQLALVLIA